MTDAQYQNFAQGKKINPCIECEPTWKNTQKEQGKCKKASSGKPPRTQNYKQRIKVFNKEYNSFSEASKLLGIPMSTLKKRCDSKKFPLYERITTPVETKKVIEVSKTPKEPKPEEPASENHKYTKAEQLFKAKKELELEILKAINKFEMNTGLGIEDIVLGWYEYKHIKVVNKVNCGVDVNGL